MHTIGVLYGGKGRRDHRGGGKGGEIGKDKMKEE